MAFHTRPTWAEISAKALLSNADLLHRRVAPADLLPVIKANGYGHGLEQCTRVLAGAGADWLSVTSVEEGVALREALRGTGLRPRVLVLSSICNGEADALFDHALTPVVWDVWQAELLMEGMQRRGIFGKPLPVHIEIDTGMARQGIRWNDSVGMNNIADFLQRESPLRAEGAMTHYASPEDFESDQNTQQTRRFASSLAYLVGLGVRPPILHAGNSATIFDTEQLGSLRALAAQHRARLMLRPGLGLFGYGVPGVELRPVLEWKTRVLSLRTIEEGEHVGYGATFTAGRTSRLAVVPCGYADGLNRLLSNRGHTLLRGCRAPIVGRVSMDLTVIDVTDVPGAGVGDEVVLIGRQGDETITSADIAELCGTIPYEVLCAISSRVPRRIVD